MTTFIRAAEIWVPDSDGYLLEFAGGLYGDAPEFGALSRKMCFGRGEGLPGRVWDEGTPIVLKDLQGGYFQRAAAAKAAGLGGAVAFPVFAGDALKAVVVLFCGEASASSAAIEVWRKDSARGGELQLIDGLRGSGDTSFEPASRTTLPCPLPADDSCMLAFLSSAEMPIATSIEVDAEKRAALPTIGPGALLSLPVVRGGRVVETIAMHF
jgi:hypothetical protein